MNFLRWRIFPPFCFLFKFVGFKLKNVVKPLISSLLQNFQWKTFQFLNNPFPNSHKNSKSANFTIPCFHPIPKITSNKFQSIFVLWLNYWIKSKPESHKNFHHLFLHHIFSINAKLSSFCFFRNAIHFSYHINKIEKKNYLINE